MEPIRIRGYKNFEIIGRGASSLVYRADQESVGRQVAVKVLNADARDPDFKHFLRERDMLAQLSNHPHVVEVYDAGATEDGHPYIAMQLYDGSLDDRIKREGTLQVDEAIQLMAGIAEAVQAAHAAGILHRDIKPQNVLLSKWGPGLADFGIARVSGNLEWSQSLAELTPLHAAPEVFEDDDRPTAQADIWSLGSTLYTALAGTAPFARYAGERIDRYASHVARDPVPPILRPDIPDGLAQLLQRALAKKPEDRFTTAGEMASALTGLKDDGIGVSAGQSSTGEPVTAPVVSDGDKAETIVRPNTGWPRKVPDPTPTGPSRRLWLVGGVAGLLLLAVLTTVGVAALTRNQTTAPPLTIPTTIPVIPVAPGLTPSKFTADDHGQIVDLHWTDNSAGQASYAIVYLSTIANSAKKTEIVPRGLTSYTVTGLDKTLGYCFRVVAIVVDGSGKGQQAFADTNIRGCQAIVP